MDAHTASVTRRAFTLGPALALLLLAGMASGCDSSDARGGDTEAVQAAAPADVRTDATPAQIRAIDALRSAYEAAWAAKDAAAFAAIYAEDAEHVNPLGGILPGREAIRTTHVFLFNGPFAGSTTTTEVRRVVFLTGTTAMVDLNVTLTGYAGRPPGLPEAAPGVVRMRAKWIVTKRGGQWEIFAQQMTALVPGTSF